MNTDHSHIESIWSMPGVMVTVLHGVLLFLLSFHMDILISILLLFLLHVREGQHTNLSKSCKGMFFFISRTVICSF